MDLFHATAFVWKTNFNEVSSEISEKFFVSIQIVNSFKAPYQSIYNIKMSSQQEPIQCVDCDNMLFTKTSETPNRKRYFISDACQTC